MLEKSHFDAAFSRQFEAQIHQFSSAAFDRCPVLVVADHIQDYNALIPSHRPEKNSGQAKRTIVVVGADRQDCFSHGKRFSNLFREWM
jgi:hypothetical protein